MPDIKIISESAISAGDLKRELERIKKRESELNYRANKTEESLNALMPSEVYKKSDELFNKLAKLDLPRLKDAYIKKMIDLTPKNIRDVKAILQSYSITLTNEQMQKIADVMNEL